MSARPSALVVLARAGGCVIAAAAAAVSGPIDPPPPASPARLVERRPDGSESEWSSPSFAARLVN